MAASVEAPILPRPADPARHERIRHGCEDDLMRRTLITAGVLVDTNGDGLANALRGRGALLESQRVERVPIYSIELQVFSAETWQTVAVDDQDVVSVAGRRSWSTTPGAWLLPQNIVFTYRVVDRAVIRWIDGTWAPARPSPSSSRPAP